ncbi:hypothetical protein EHS25_001930 [Saitozyma podzolica]|uniref:Potassium uptake protein n=1 Tax=Saitozyma podzolica TaxID=1890683 RepID=A0A427YG81_9TREE|nr:hypothetical protein EHS25_001930 [Saitozyma podzolica]
MSRLDKEAGYSRRPLKLSGFKLLGMAFSTLGIIYSDIGEPMSRLHTDELPPSTAATDINPGALLILRQEDIVGGISAIVWSLTLLPLLKYVCFALEFGTGEGEGGPFALYMTLFPKRDPTDEQRSLTTYTTMDSKAPCEKGRLGKLANLRWPLLVWAIFGTALTLSDGILTSSRCLGRLRCGGHRSRPAVCDQRYWGISIAFLIFLFGLQPLGTQKIAFFFAPVTATWLALLGATGIYNIVSYPAIWRAYDPSRAILWFVRTGSYDNLAGVLLAITGCEAMFANLGQFNKAAIRISFAGYAYPMLVLAYLGQGARLIQDPTVIANVFYLTIPGPTGGGLYWIMFIFAVLATLIASQAMISGTFSLVHQLIGMNALPALRIKHTSRLNAGQIYIGALNWLLMIGTIAVVGGFGSSSALTLAYGFAVATVLFVTTTLISVSIPFVKHLPYILGLAFFLFFGFLDGLFWGASLKKVPLGAWFPLGLGCLLTAFIVFWSWARGLEDSFDDSNAEKLSRIITRRALDEKSPLRKPVVNDTEGVSNDDLHLSHSVEADAEEELSTQGSEHHIPPLYLRAATGESTVLTRIPVMAIFHRNDAANRGVPHSFVSFLQRYPALPEIVIFLSTRIVGVPHVPEDDRYIVNKVRSLQGFYGVTLRVGYLDSKTPSLPVLLPYLTSIEARSSASPAPVIDALTAAVHNATHFIPSYTVISRRSGWVPWVWVRRILIEEIYGRARVIFPDYVAALDAMQDDTIHVAVSAVI